LSAPWRATALISRIFETLLLDQSTSPVLPTLSLHDALPIFADRDDPRIECRVLGDRHRPDLDPHAVGAVEQRRPGPGRRGAPAEDRKSTRLNSSYVKISYAVFCLKKKKAVKAGDTVKAGEAL